MQGSNGQLATAMLCITLGLLKTTRELRRRPISLGGHLVLQVGKDSDLGIVMETKGAGNTGSNPKVPLVPPDSHTVWKNNQVTADYIQRHVTDGQHYIPVSEIHSPFPLIFLSSSLAWGFTEPRARGYRCEAGTAEEGSYAHDRQALHQLRYNPSPKESQ